MRGLEKNRMGRGQRTHNKQTKKMLASKNVLGLWTLLFLGSGSGKKSKKKGHQTFWHAPNPPLDILPKLKTILMEFKNIKPLKHLGKG